MLSSNNKRSLGCILFLILLIVCGFFLKYIFDNKDLVTLDNEIIKIQTNFYTEYNEFASNLQNSTNTKEISLDDYNKLKLAIDSSLSKLNELDEVKGGEDLKSGAIKLFESYRKVIYEDLNSILELTYKENRNEDDDIALAKLTFRFQAQLNKSQKDYWEVRNAFINENNFKLD